MRFDSYDELTMEQRVNSIEDARREGREAAKRDWDADSTDHRKASPLTFLLHVIQPACDADLVSDEAAEMWTKELEALDTSDPRTAAFIAGYNEELAEMVEALEA